LNRTAQESAKTEEPETIRPTKKQKELLTFIEDFIAEHGYSPSYREIMAGTGHTSVATVSLHVNNLIKRGHLAKRDRSARSLEVVKPKSVSDHELDKLYVLIGALKVLGQEGAAQSFIPRLGELKKRQEDNQYSV
jgi:SOS-response transcriptional repressor LexA